ncbi:hypothetical protein FQR65_LT13648 [Abscondita terminalis]|nr:hypothetical protein FQR65_LT13648 [Abscondita terminalis]
MKHLKILRRFLSTHEIKSIIRENRCGFDRNLKKVIFTEVGCGRCAGELLICEEHISKRNTLHGGMALTLVNAFTTYGLLTHCDCLNVPSLPMEMYLAYLKPCKRGDEVEIVAETIKVGKKLAFTKCAVRHKERGDLVVFGYHTKYLMRQ